MKLPMEAAIPLPIQVVIDDVGWRQGRDGSAWDEPYRTGVARAHGTLDYAAIASMGRQLNIRPQAAFIACEWDKENILAELPSCTWMGADWDNRRNVGNWQTEAAQILRENREFIELTLHGVGHEFWQNGRLTRAEWHDENGVMRSRDEVLKRLELFGRILEQHDLGAFPTSFVPCAFYHRFETERPGLSTLLKSVGINFISTPFDMMHGAELLQGERFGFDDGVLTVDRGRDLLDWKVIGTAPQGEINGPICGLHWPNLLHPNPQCNEEIVGIWAKLLRAVGQRFDRVLARDTREFADQLLYHASARCCVEGDSVRLEWQGESGDIIVKVAAPQPLNWAARDAEIVDCRSEIVAGRAICTLTVRPHAGARAARLVAIEARPP